MSNTKVEVSGGGVGFFGLLSLVFITLKLCGTIDWSWWCLLILILCAFLAGVFTILEKVIK